MLRDDTASALAWMDPQTGAFAGMQPGSVGIEMSTVTPTHAKQLHIAAITAGSVFLDAPVAGSLPQAEAGQLVVFVGGEQAVIAQVEPILQAMSNPCHTVGDAGSAATLKLMINALMGTQLALIAELLGMAQKTGLDPARALEIIGATPVSSPIL